MGEGLLYSKYSGGGNLLWGKVYSMTPGLSKMYVAKPLPLSLRNDVVMHSAGFTIMLRCA